MQTELTANPVLIDARLTLPVTNRLSLKAGVFKAPFSKDFLRSSSDLLFLDRARVTGTLAPNREIGIAA